MTTSIQNEDESLKMQNMLLLHSYLQLKFMIFEIIYSI